MTAALSDITLALHSDSLSAAFAERARSVYKEVKALLVADGVDIDSLNLAAPPPVVGPGVKHSYSY